MMQRALHLPHRNIGLFYSVRTPDEFAYAGWNSVAWRTREKSS